MCRRVLLTGALAAVGCGGGGMTAVTGTVTCDGRPVTNGYVTLVPDGPGEGASGQIGPDGRFALSTFAPNDGVRPGRYRVRVASYESEARMDVPGSGRPALPEKYFDAAKSGLTVTVEGRRAQTLDLALTKD
ncbi:MAG: hypothetical protein C0501_26670 [Isosphaera sp.]|nr:hypothetical protein [Isosphaera sp.]